MDPDASTTARGRRTQWLASTVLVIIVLVVLSLCVGAYRVAPGELVRILMSLTAAVGAPFFVWLLARTSDRR